MTKIDIYSKLSDAYNQAYINAVAEGADEIAVAADDLLEFFLDELDEISSVLNEVLSVCETTVIEFANSPDLQDDETWRGGITFAATLHDRIIAALALSNE